jgi:adenylylsulfate kinase
MNDVNKNIFAHPFLISKEDRKELMGHSSFVIWFTGMSGAGKSTLASNLELELYKKKIKTFCLDGDNVRMGLNSNLGFSSEDRTENIRRVGEVSKLMMNAGLVVLSSFISPFKKDRMLVRSLFKENEFVEIYVKCPLEVCETRDPKGLYKKARANELEQMTGVDSTYEEPENPDLIIDTANKTLQESVSEILNYLKINHKIG